MKNKVIAMVIFAILISIAAFGVYQYYIYISDNDNVIDVFDESSITLIIGDEIIKEQPIINDGEVSLSLELIKQYLDPNIWFDKASKTITITTGEKLIRMKTDQLEAYVNSKPIKLKIPVVEKDGTTYVPLNFLSQYYNIEIKFINSNIVLIDYIEKLFQTAELVKPIDKNITIRKDPSRKSPIIKKIVQDTDENMILRVFEEQEKWYKVRTEDGFIGYIEKRFVVVKWITRQESPKDNNVSVQWKPKTGKINLTWEMVVNKNPDTSKIPKMEGLDVVSPTWFQVSDENGSLINRASSSYVQWAHKNDYKVWALFSNDTKNPTMTQKFLSNPEARDNVIRQVLAYAALYKFDGINIDFENIKKEDKNALTQFVRELTPMIREQGLVVSIDVTVPDGSDNWSLCYDRKALGEVVDYVMLMAYDQYWASSPVAGSVAQITWVEKNIKKVLELVPKEKLILGMPFYTRLWKEEIDKNGKIKLSSNVLSMDASQKDMRENKVEVKWDNDSGQFYGEYLKNDAKYKVWIEDENSINLKASMVQKYNLAGGASWRRSNESSRVWSVLNKSFKEIGSYQEWVEQNGSKSYVFGK